MRTMEKKMKDKQPEGIVEWEKKLRKHLAIWVVEYDTSWEDEKYLVGEEVADRMVKDILTDITKALQSQADKTREEALMEGMCELADYLSTGEHSTVGMRVSAHVFNNPRNFNMLTIEKVVSKYFKEELETLILYLINKLKNK